jgi:hypothetical protein
VVVELVQLQTVWLQPVAITKLVELREEGMSVASWLRWDQGVCRVLMLVLQQHQSQTQQVLKVVYAW